MKTGLLLICILLTLSVIGCKSKPAVVCNEENAASDDCKQKTLYFRDELEPDAASGGGRPASHRRVPCILQRFRLYE